MHISTLSKNTIKIMTFILFCIIILTYSPVYSAPPHVGETSTKRITTLWSDKEECITEDAFMIAIEEYGDTFKVAACVKYGCRIAVPEFGKKTQGVNYRKDPRFVWLSDSIFETIIYKKNRRFYKCNI